MIGLLVFSRGVRVSNVYVATVKSVFNIRTQKTRYYMYMNKEYWARISFERYYSNMESCNWKEPVSRDTKGGVITVVTECYFQIKTKQRGKQ